MDNVQFRDVVPADFATLWKMASDWEVVRQLGGWPWPPKRDFTKNRCKPYDKGNGFVWAVCLEGQMIGVIGITGGDLGYMYHPDVKGRGIATFAARRAIEHAFSSDTALERLTGSVWHDNVGSKRVLTKLGFTHWQTCYIRAKARDIPTQVYNHHLTRAAWERLRSRA